MEGFKIGGKEEKKRPAIFPQKDPPRTLLPFPPFSLSLSPISLSLSPYLPPICHWGGWGDITYRMISLFPWVLPLSPLDIYYILYDSSISLSSSFLERERERERGKIKHKGQVLARLGDR